MKKALIIGAAGFVGNYLIDHIQKNCIWSIAVTKIAGEEFDREGIETYDLDILDPAAIHSLLETVRPDLIFHLAAQSSVGLSWKKPDLTVDVNIKGTLHLLEAIREIEAAERLKAEQQKQPNMTGNTEQQNQLNTTGNTESSYHPRLLLIGSGEEYGHVRTDEIPIIEDNVVRPGNIYAATKACQNMLGKIYSDAYHLDIMSVRAFNHIGPNQAPMFVVADFCKQVSDIEKGLQEPVIRVGNLSARRDFTDVRDVVRAYVMLMEHGSMGETYNIGSGHAVEIQAILDNILKLTKCPIDVEVDEKRLRPVDVPVIEADITKLVECCNWKREIPLEQTLSETLEYWRNK